MEQFTYKGHAIEVHYGYNGKSIYIRNAEGIQIYAHKFTGDALAHAKLILGEEVKEKQRGCGIRADVRADVHPDRPFINRTLTPAQMFQARVDRILQQVAA